MNDEIYKNILEVYKESGPFYISKNPKIKIGESDFHGTSYLVVYINAGVIELDHLLNDTSFNILESEKRMNDNYNSILDKITEWNYAYNLKKEYFNN